MPTDSPANISRTGRYQLSQRQLIAIAVLVLILGAIAYGKRSNLFAGHPQKTETDEKAKADQARSWLAANAIRLNTVEAGHGFADMQPLKKIIGDARIVALGEATHGTREFFQLKHRMLEFLASEKGFTIFAIEANMPEAYRLNDYVLNGNDDPAKLIAGMYFWTWNTEEVLDMVLWMREFNKSGKGRVQFTGFDMQTPNVAADIVSDFVAKNDAGYAGAVSQASDLAKAAQQTNSRSFGVATGSFPVKDAAGKRVRLSGYIKTQEVTEGYAGLWWRVDGAAGTLAFDNMRDRGVTGTTDWKRYDVELQVAADAANINFGVLFPANGTAWFDSLTIELDGVSYPANNNLNLDFESALLDDSDAVRYPPNTPLGFHAGGKGYQVQLVADVFHSGKQSLRMTYGRTAGGGNSGGVGPGVAPVNSGGTNYNRVFSGREVSQKPRILSKPEPNYTGDARKNNVTGTVVLRAVFSSSGQVTNITAVKELPNGLTESAIAAARSIKFVPAMKDGHDVSMWMQLEYNFNPPAEQKTAVATWQAVVRHLEESRDAYTKKNVAAQDIEWAIQNARVVLQCLQLRRNEVSRDQSMADNIKWILDHNPGTKVVVWAHNGHVGTAANGYEPMGTALRKMFGSQMVVFGFAFNQGSFQAVEMPPSKSGLRTFHIDPAPEGSLDAMLASANLQIAAIDLHALPKDGPVANWFAEVRDTKSIGAVYSEEFANKFFAKQVIANVYDALLFIEKTTAARPLKEKPDRPPPVTPARPLTQ
jgi:TonB family protein